MEMSKRYKKADGSSCFFSLLPAAKQKRVQFYKELPRIKQWLTDGKEVVTRLTRLIVFLFLF